MDEILKIQLFGCIEAEYKGMTIGINSSKSKSKKMWILFEYLVLNHHRSVSQEELIDILWPNMNVQNPLNSLKVLVFKVRHELDELGYVPGKEIILSSRGSYKFNDNIPYKVDCFEFEALIKKSNDSQISDEEVVKLLKEAQALFYGNTLTGLSNEPWSISFQTHYNEMYKSGVLRAVKVLVSMNEYEEVIEMCKKALLVQPFEEAFYFHTIRAYAALENYTAAAEMYNQVKNLMEDELYTTPDPRFEKAYKDIMKERPKKNVSITEFKKDMEETINYMSCFYVEYGEFKQIYRVCARRLERLEFGAYLCLFTLGIKKGVSVDDVEKQENMKILEDALAFMLRQGDVFCRVSPNQFGVIILDITEEIASSIAGRIENYFKNNKKRQDFGILHSITEIEASAFDKKSK